MIETYATRRGRRKLTGMTPSRLRLVALAGMVAFLLGAAACAETPEPAQDRSAALLSSFDEILARTYNSIEAIRTRANAGDADAQYNLGEMYATGRGVPQDDVEAVRWYRKAAEQGNAVAQYYLGITYATGTGVPQDDVEAVAWYRKAAEQGDVGSQYYLGMMYRTGDSVPQDDGEAYKWFNLAATYADAEDREDFTKLRDLTAESLAPEQRADAQRRAREFFEAHPPK